MWRPRNRRQTYTIHTKWCQRWPGRSVSCWDRVALEAKTKRIRSNDWDAIAKLVTKWEHLT